MDLPADDTADRAAPAPFREAWRPQRSRGRLQRALDTLAAPADNGGTGPGEDEDAEQDGNHDLPSRAGDYEGRPPDLPDVDAPPATPAAIEPRSSSRPSGLMVDESGDTTAIDDDMPALPQPRPDASAEGPLPAAGEEPLHVIVDVTPRTRQELATADTVHYGLGDRWGAAWRGSAQGWVGADRDTAVWRPVVSTTNELSRWVVDTYLGVVTAEVAIEAHGGDLRQLGATLAEGREVGHRGLVEEAVERGAHAVIGVSMDYTPIGDRLLITLTGTAVTLRDRS